MLAISDGTENLETILFTKQDINKMSEYFCVM